MKTKTLRAKINSCEREQLAFGWRHVQPINGREGETASLLKLASVARSCAVAVSPHVISIVMRFILFVTIFFTGTLCVTAQKDSPVVDLAKERIAAEQLISFGIKFNQTLHADGILSQGGTWFGSVYVFTDNTTVSYSGEKYKNSKAARKSFQEKLKSALLIIEDTKLTTKKKGSSEGKTFLAAYKGKSENEFIFTRVYMLKNSIGVTSSISLKHLLAYELINNKSSN